MKDSVEVEGRSETDGEEDERHREEEEEADGREWSLRETESDSLQKWSCSE